jgi:hypothetical protein
MADKPKVNSHGQRELDKTEAQFEKFDEQVKSLTLDRLNEAPKLETEQQTKLSNRELQKNDGIYLKPANTISCQEKFNEKYRDDYNYMKEYVPFVAENKEIIGDVIELWTKPFAGVHAEFWKIPPNKKVNGPRYLAEQIKKCSYHRLIMNEQKIIGSNQFGQEYGQLIVDTTVQRLDAHPVADRKSIFMGAAGF